MNSPTWSQCLLAITLLAILGFGLVIVSGFWPHLALLTLAAALAGRWRSGWTKNK